MTFHAAPEFERIWFDVGTPPWDRDDLWLALRKLVEAADPREMMRIVPERNQLLEFVVRSSTSGHRYGMLLIDMGHVADGVAYWREPPLYIDASSPVPHGFSRAHALQLATRRLEASR